MATPAAHDWTTFANWIDRFEAARRTSVDIDLADFLPERSHPLYCEVAAELIRVDLEYAWMNGVPKSLDDYRALAPEVFTEPPLLAGAAFEEYRLRRLAGERVNAVDYADRFGISVADWPAVEPSSVPGQPSQAEAVPPGFPCPGQQFAGFDLEAVLGRGAFAIVYLARQADLARRYVALKVTSSRSMEAQHLARLQHTNIVPIYSIHEEDGLLAVCMPYFGDRTLAKLLAEFAHSTTLPTSGQALLSTRRGWPDDTRIDGGPLVCQTWQRPESPRAVRSAAANPANTTYVDAILKLIAEVSAGLDHAHQRGIVHRDVKPANILVTAEGRPLLLDFNLSKELVVNGRESLTVGGTLPYMAPEHLRAVRDGGTVDARSDVYSLGVIMYELLAGARPFPVRSGAIDFVIDCMLDDRSGGSPPIRRHNANVPPSVESILQKCLEPDPARRYGSAQALGEDLERHLHDLPLFHADNPSVMERIGKWRRRHPRLVSASTLVGAILALVVIFAALWHTRGRYVARLEAQQKYHRFVTERPLARMAISLPDTDEALLALGVDRAAEAIQIYGLLNGTDIESQAGIADLPAAGRAQLKDQLAELAYLAARGETILARRSNEQRVARTHLEHALQFNKIARQCAGPGGEPRVVTQQWRELRQLLELPAASLPPPTATIPKSVDAYLDVQVLLEARNYAMAEPLLESLLAQHPTDPVCWLLLGNVKAGLGKLAEAEGCYTTAASLQPDSYVAIYNRALCRTQLKRFAAALADFERVLNLQPDLPCVLLNRALAYEASGDLPRALADLNAAVANGRVPPRAYFLRARVRTKLGETAGAEADRREGLKHEPKDDVDWVARGAARLGEDPVGALEDFQKALVVNPHSQLALQNIVHVAADRLNRPEVALDALNKWLAIDPSNAAALVGRAVLQGRAGARDEVMADIDAALKLSQEPTILFQAACALSCLAESNNSDSARGLLLLSRALELDPRLVSRAKTDADLRSLRALPEFAELTKSLRDLRRVQESFQHAAATGVR